MPRAVVERPSLQSIATLAPSQQAALLAQVVQRARLVRTAVAAEHAAAEALADAFGRALEQAMDAERPHETSTAQSNLQRVIVAMREAGLRVRAEFEEIECDGLLGAMRMPVLTAVVARS